MSELTDTETIAELAKRNLFLERANQRLKGDVIKTAAEIEAALEQYWAVCDAFNIDRDSRPIDVPVLIEGRLRERRTADD